MIVRDFEPYPHGRDSLKRCRYCKRVVDTGINTCCPYCTDPEDHLSALREVAA